jgi:transposase InsO family protein
MDVLSRKVVGWSMATHMRENLVMDAPGQAVNCVLSREPEQNTH